MRSNRTNNSKGQEYLVMFKVYVQADGSTVVVIGNQRLEVQCRRSTRVIVRYTPICRRVQGTTPQDESTTLAILGESSVVASRIKLTQHSASFILCMIEEL